MVNCPVQHKASGQRKIVPLITVPGNMISGNYFGATAGAPFSGMTPPDVKRGAVTGRVLETVTGRGQSP